VDVTERQFEAFEAGALRISAPMLYRLCVAVDVPVGYFFEGFAAGCSPSPQIDPPNAPEGGD